MTKKSTASDEKRKRVWATIIYPDSAPKDWLTKLADARIAGFLSPLHTDTDEETHLEKKPHYHFEAQFSSLKSLAQAKDAFSVFGGVGAEDVKDFRTYARYLCHLDQPNKKRYDPKDVKAFGGLDYISTVESVADRYDIISEIIDFCESHSNEIGFSFARLTRYAMANKPTWFRHLADDCACFIREYLNSAAYDFRCSISGRNLVTLDPETGEVFQTLSPDPDPKSRKKVRL